MANRADIFDRIDAGSLGTPSDGGSAWFEHDANAYGIVGDKAHDISGSGWHVATLESGVANCIVQVTFAVAVDQMCLALRVTDNANFLFIHSSAADGYRFFKQVAGGNTLLGTYVATPANNDVISVVCDGDNLEMSLNGTPRITPTPESFNNTATKHGLAGYNLGGSAARWENFSITDPAAASAKPAAHYYSQRGVL